MDISDPPPDNPESRKILKQVPGLPPKPKPFFPVVAIAPVEGLLVLGAGLLALWVLKGGRRV
jgi:hypothetical protein